MVLLLFYVSPFFCFIPSRTLSKRVFLLLLFFNHGKFHTYTVERMV